MLKRPFLPKLDIMRLRKILVFLIVVAFVFYAGYFLGRQGFKASATGITNVQVSREVPQDKQDVDFGLFWRVWDTLATSYFDKSKLDPVKMVYGAIQGMVSAVGDPYTVFLPPDENKVVEEDLKGSFSGVGIQIGFRGTQLAVIAPLPDSPAEKAGIKAGDFIVGIKDEKKNVDRGTVGISLPDAVQLIRGPSGSTVSLALLREGSNDPIIVDVVREEINVPSVMLSFVGENEDIADVRLLKFAGETDGEWGKVVQDVLKSGSNKLILDLRNNPGGYLQGAVDIAGEFLRNGSVVVIEESANGSRNEFKTDKLPRLANVKMVVLVNKGSASASEILSGALREQANIEIIGETTFGKGTIQEPRQLENGAGLHITTARWLTPKGNWVNETGLEPDVIIEDNPDTAEDEQLLKAIEELNK
jgi:carboxyl-terminal processing protease